MEVPLNLRRPQQSKLLQLLEGMKQLVRHQQLRLHKIKQNQHREKFSIEYIIFLMSRYG